MSFATLLSIKVDGQEVLTDYGARDLTAEIEYIPQSEAMGRSWNGGIIDYSLPQFRKFQMAVTCTDFESNGLARFPPGTQCTVVCLPHLGTREDDSENRLVMNMVMGRWKESRQEWAAKTTWTLPLQEM